VSVARPDAALAGGLRELPLPDFPKVELALVYRDHGAMPLFDLFVAETRRYVAQLKSKRLKPREPGRTRGQVIPSGL
jgi:hypothetical protein